MRLSAEERDRVLDEMRAELVAHLLHFFRWRRPVLYCDRQRYRDGLRAHIRRVRALDAVRQEERSSKFASTLWMYMACGLDRDEAIERTRKELGWLPVATKAPKP